MTLLDILICSVLTLSVWGIYRILLGAHEVIPGINEPPQNGWHPEHPAPSLVEGAYTGGAIRGLMSVFLLSLSFWSLIYLGWRAML